MYPLEAYGLVPLADMRGELAHASRGLPLHNADGTICAFAMVDEGDHLWLSRFSWSLDPRGRYTRMRGSDGKTVKLHRQILGLRPGDGLDSDHINRDRLDNRRGNLRVCTRAQNRQNTAGWTGASSRYRGVSYDGSRGKWKAYGTLNYRYHHIGRFDTEQEAADAAARWREQHMPYAID